MQLPREARRRIAMGHGRPRRAEDVSVAFIAERRPGRRIWLGIADVGGALLSAHEAERLGADLIEAAGADRSLGEDL